MDWAAQVDNYCERLEPGFWAEPLNAMTNLMFIAAAAWVFPRVRGDRGAEILCFSLFLIGIGSGLFHTLATQWAEIADSLSILVFILIYAYLATSRVLQRPGVLAFASPILLFPYAIAVGFVMTKIVGALNGSTGYLPVAILIFIYGLFAGPGQIRHGLFIGAGLLAVSLVFRTIDAQICNAFPAGTHFIWHSLNGIMLGWMILVIHRAGLRR